MREYQPRSEVFVRRGVGQRRNLCTPSLFDFLSHPFAQLLALCWRHDEVVEKIVDNVESPFRLVTRDLDDLSPLISLSVSREISDLAQVMEVFT